MTEMLQPDEFVEHCLKGDLTLIDSRSEGEFGHGHIPGAVNIPLLNNEHRRLVGTEYKRKGREAAVLLGFQLVGPHFAGIIESVRKQTDRRDVLLYCWRGGMRSSITAWILSMAGFHVRLLRGGYKEFRKRVLRELEIERRFIIIGGHTGCGKTEVLRELSKAGEQVLDLELFANHRGSAFGQLGLPPQPTNEHFENLVALKLMGFHPGMPIWAEAESRSIGRVKVPDHLFVNLQSSPLVEIESSPDHRMRRILDEYGKFSHDDLAACTSKLEKRLGNLRMKEALKALEDSRMQDWLSILMEYYDKNYSYSLGERNPARTIRILMQDGERAEDFSRRLLESSASLRDNTPYENRSGSEAYAIR
jgi:tRNA 2-selenouridine synthase